MCFTRHGRVRNEDLVFLFLHLVEKWTVMEKCDWIKGVLPNSHQGWGECSKAHFVQILFYIPMSSEIKIFQVYGGQFSNRVLWLTLVGGRNIFLCFMSCFKREKEDECTFLFLLFSQRSRLHLLNPSTGILSWRNLTSEELSDLAWKHKVIRSLWTVPPAHAWQKGAFLSEDTGITRGMWGWRLEGGSRKRASYSEILERHWRHTLQA
jgi:hypothetical protein